MAEDEYTWEPEEHVLHLELFKEFHKRNIERIQQQRDLELQRQQISPSHTVYIFMLDIKSAQVSCFFFVGVNYFLIQLGKLAKRGGGWLSSGATSGRYPHLELSEILTPV